jgi:hypothetical protein
MAGPTDPPGWVNANQGRAEDAFQKAAQEKEESQKAEQEKKDKATKDRAQKEETHKQEKLKTYHEPKGPGADASRRQVRQGNAIRRAKKLEAQKKAAGMEQEAKRKEIGREEAAKKQHSSPQQGKNGQQLASAAKADRAEAQKSRAVERSERLKVAQEFKDSVKSKDGFEK